MDVSQVKGLVEEGARRLFERQRNIFAYTSATGQTEWNLGHHLAFELQALLPDFDCDLDIMKRNYGNRRPDIIFHRRGTHDRNYLVVEVKLDGDEAEFEHELERIAEYWFSPPLRYQFGAVVNLKSDRTCEVRTIGNE